MSCLCLSFHCDDAAFMMLWESMFFFVQNFARQSLCMKCDRDRDQVCLKSPSSSRIVSHLKSDWNWICLENNNFEELVMVGLQRGCCYNKQIKILNYWDQISTCRMPRLSSLATLSYCKKIPSQHNFLERVQQHDRLSSPSQHYISRESESFTKYCLRINLYKQSCLEITVINDPYTASRLTDEKMMRGWRKVPIRS